MDMFTVYMGAEQSVWMLDDENIVELHHKMHYTLSYTVRSVWAAQRIFISLCIEIEAYFIWYFSCIIHLDNSQNLLALFVCLLSMKKLIGVN